MSKGMVNLAGDMASFNNATPEETLDALRSGISGETEPLRRFGVLLSQARIEAGGDEHGARRRARNRSTTQAQRARDASADHLKDTKDAQGDFARTSDSLANQQRILAAQYENVTAAIGQTAPADHLAAREQHGHCRSSSSASLTAAVVALGDRYGRRVDRRARRGLS